MVHPFQDAPFSVAALRESYRNVGGLFHVTTQATANEVACTGIKRRSETGVSPLSQYGQSDRLYFFGRRQCAQKWARSMMSIQIYSHVAIVEFLLHENTPIAWDHNPGMDQYLAFSTHVDISPTNIIVVETVNAEPISTIGAEY